MSIHNDLRCAYLACSHHYTATRTGGRKYRIQHVHGGGKVWEYAQELDNTQLWICNDTCEANVRWIGAWNRRSVAFTRTNVNGNGDCLFEASSSPGVRTVTRTTLLDWLIQQHIAYDPEKSDSLPLSLQLLAAEMLNLVKEYLVAPEFLREDLETSKLEAAWYFNLTNKVATLAAAASGCELRENERKINLFECQNVLNFVELNFRTAISLKP